VTLLSQLNDMKTICGQNVEFVMLNLLIQKVTSGGFKGLVIKSLISEINLNFRISFVGTLIYVACTSVCETVVRLWVQF